MTCRRSPNSDTRQRSIVCFRWSTARCGSIDVQLQQVAPLLALDAGRRAFGDQLAGHHQAETIALLGFFEIVRRDQNGRARVGQRLISRQKARRAIGSTPEVGSSRNSTLGSCMMAAPNATRCFQPPGRLPTS